MSGRGIIAEEPPQACEMCGKIEECRPYGPNDEQICFDCMMSSPEMEKIAKKKMAQYIFGEEDDGEY